MSTDLTFLPNLVSTPSAPRAGAGISSERRYNQTSTNPELAHKEPSPAVVISGVTGELINDASRVPVVTNPMVSDNDWKKVALALTNKTVGVSVGEKPSFRSPEVHHPVLFLNKLNRYLKITGVASTEQLDVAKECLIGPAADWRDLREVFWTSFEVFQNDFLGLYWSDDRQYYERSRLSSMKYNPDKTRLSISEYFLRQVNSYRLFSPPIPELIIINEIIRQLPTNIQSLWTTVNNRTMSGVLEFLDRQNSLYGKRTRANISSPLPTTAMIDRYHYVKPSSSTVSDTEVLDFSVPPPKVCKSCDCHRSGQVNSRRGN